MQFTDAQISAIALAVTNGVVSALGAIVEEDAPAKTKRASKPAVTVTPAKADKVYRSAKGKEQAKADVAALWAKTLKQAKVTKRAQLTDAQFEAYQAGAKAIWAAVPKTRSTKA